MDSRFFAPHEFQRRTRFDLNAFAGFFGTSLCEKPTVKPAHPEVPRRAVLETTELLEQILLAMDARDTIVSVRVCRRWLECARALPSMPQHLFFEFKGLSARNMLCHAHPETFSTGGWGSSLDSDITRLDTFSLTGIAEHGEDLALEDKFVLTPVRLCTLLRLVKAELPLTRRLADTPDNIPQELVELICSPNKINSWGGMLLTEPACTRATVVVGFAHKVSERRLPPGSNWLMAGISLLVRSWRKS